MKKVQPAEPVPSAEPIPFDLDRKYTVEQVSEMLNKSTKTVYNLIKARKLKAYRIGREFIITASQLNDYAEGLLLKKWFPAYFRDELDPAYIPPEPEEVDIDSLTDEQILNAYVIPSEWFGASMPDADAWIHAARLAGLDKDD